MIIGDYMVERVNIMELLDNVIELNFDEISDYSFPLNKSFGLIVNYNNVKYDLIVKFSKNNKNLICAGPGAHQRTETTSKGILKKPPYFDRHTWHKYFKESYIAYADPIFYNDEKIRLGGLLGIKTIGM